VTDPVERRVRIWLALAAVLAQLAAAAAGLLPGLLLPVTVGATAGTTWFARQPSTRLSRTGYVLAAAVVLNAVRQLADRPDAATSAGLSSSLSTLTLTLVLLSVVLAPTWQRLRDYRLWLAMSASVTVAACATGSGRGEAILLVATWLMLLICAAALQSWSLSAAANVVVTADARAGWNKKAVRVVPVALSLALGTLVFAALPGGLGGGNLPVRLVHYVHPPATFTPTRGMLGVDTMGSGDLDLRVRGALPTTPLLLVPTNAPPLWRGTVYRDYTGDDWRAAALGDGLDHHVLRGSDLSLPATTEDPVPVGVTRTDVAHREPGVASWLAWSPGVIRRVQADMFGALSEQGTLRLFGSRGDDSYTVTSVVAQRSPAALQQASGPDVVDKSWTALPAELPQQVTDLARRITAGDSMRYEQVQAIQTYLRSHERYALNSPVPAANEDAVDRFLFHDHVGFCEQFASAEAVLLRAIGVPARVVSGLAYGHQQSDGVLFTEADAHAWVEVYYPGIGWSPTDPTAGVHPATAEGHQGLLAAHPVIGTASLTMLILSTLASFVIRRRRKVRQADPAPGPVLQAFLGFVRRTRQPREPAETAREYLARHNSIAPLAEALEALETECYGADDPSPPRVAHALQLFAASQARGDSTSG
jgi:transglutaminase-like putative cysteine protease